MLLSRWNGLQMAIENEWGGHDSLKKSEQLAYDIVSWFSQFKEPPYVEDLENLLHESLLLSFNTDIEDGSIEEVCVLFVVSSPAQIQHNFFNLGTSMEIVAEQLMNLHEEYLQIARDTLINNTAERQSNLLSTR
ncbi:hypothetical protein Vadar_018480 [Vaccinium darrowii]|uniref:Uncharacterized protein n=1 Tax=Vaccinium darrowii TaxID=229202 RepID=A0ACB7YWT2_9ERIC|nr:hypothetical protein Vadar_018480 [Vaccinium darrowii]